MNISPLNPLISVNIITYNRAIQVINSVKSVLNQTYNNYEIIVVDDGSTDNTEQLIQEFSKEVSYFKLPKKGKVYCRNYALKRSRGHFIAFIDSDDLWNENYLNESLKIMHNNRLDILFNRSILHQYQPRVRNLYIYSYSELRKLILFQCPTPTSGMVIRNENLNQLEWIQKYNLNEDWHLQIRLVIYNQNLKAGFNPKLLWTKNEAEENCHKKLSKKYLVKRWKAYNTLLNSIKKHLSITELMIAKSRNILYQIKPLF